MKIADKIDLNYPGSIAYENKSDNTMVILPALASTIKFCF